MGLALHNPSDLDYLSNLTEHRHLPGRTPDVNPWAKHARRPLDFPQWKAYNCHERVADPEWSSVFGKPSANLRPHHIALYNANVSRNRRPKPGSQWTGPHSARLAAARLWCEDDVDEGREVARSRDIKLPGEYRRPPSLERQDAFRDVKTAKRGLKRSWDSAQQQTGFTGALAADDDELYRLGLLYDDEHERGEAFSLDAIVHDEPLWNVQFRRPAKKRGRNLRSTVRGGEEEYALDLALSFAALGDDEALAAFLLAPGEDELAEATPGSGAETGSRSQAANPSLTVIYELEEDMENAEDAKDAKDVHVSTCWARSLQKSTEGEEDNDWAFLDQTVFKDKEEDGSDDGDTTTNADPDIWIMLGGDGSKQVRI